MGDYRTEAASFITCALFYYSLFARVNEVRCARARKIEQLFFIAIYIAIRRARQKCNYIN